jgi:hypothetical protein
VPGLYAPTGREQRRGPAGQRGFALLTGYRKGVEGCPRADAPTFDWGNINVDNVP